VLVLVRIAAIVGVAGIAAMPRAARGAQPIPKAAPQIESHEPALHCGVLPRGSDAFKTCIDAESRRDALKFGEPIMPVFSSR
jgi:hypothetical protein